MEFAASHKDPYNVTHLTSQGSRSFFDQAKISRGIELLGILALEKPPLLESGVSFSNYRPDSQPNSEAPFILIITTKSDLRSQWRKLATGLVILILSTIAYISLSKPSEPLQSAALPPKTVHPISIDVAMPPEEKSTKPKAIPKKTQNQYRKCEPVRGQPGAKMCQDQNGQWHLIGP